MDKYEYKLKTEQMLELMNDNAYNKAAEIADTIDWKRVRNSTMLGTVSEIYEKNRDYQKSYDVLRIAYNRAEGSRKIISRLCTLALKTRNVDEAIDYYDDFLEVAPKDPNQFILKYQILRAQRAPIEQQIHALEEFKKAEYIEEWAYELAKLYQEAGMTAECLEECDDLILWFSEGKYVYQAMELKMQYKPLTPSQQEKYDRRYEKMSISNETEEIPDLEQYQQRAETAGKVGVQMPEEAMETTADSTKEEVVSADSGEKDSADTEKAAEAEVSEAPVQQPVKKKIGNTMKLDEALRSLLNIKLKTDEEPAETPGSESEESEDDLTSLENDKKKYDKDLFHPESKPEEYDEDLIELESKIEEIESVADLNFAEKVAEERARRRFKVDQDLEELIPEPEEEPVGETDAKQTDDTADTEKKEEGDSKKSGAKEVAGDQIEGQMSFMDLFDDWKMPETEEISEETEEFTKGGFGEITEDEAEEFTEDGFGEITEGEAEEFAEDGIEEITEDEAEEFAEDGIGEKPEDEAAAGAGIESPVITETEIKEGETMEDKKKEMPILSPDIQHLIDEIEGNVPAKEEDFGIPEDYDYEDLPDEEEYEEEDVFEWGAEDALDEDEAGAFAGVFEQSEEFFEEEDAEALVGEHEEEYDEAEEYEDEYDEAEEYEEKYDEADEYEEDDEYDLELDDEESVEESIEEEFRPHARTNEIDDREIPDEEDEIDILSATTPLSRKETAKLIATGKTAPLPLDEISDALSLSDTGFVVHGRYDLKTQSGIGTRAGLTEEQKKLFSYFVPVRGMSEQLVDVLEQDKNCTNRQGTSCTGNLLIIGNKGNGKTVLAVDVVKAIQKQRKIRQGKVAIVTGESLNKKKISEIVAKLYGGALIIEKAGRMNEKTVSRLNKAMEHDTGELLIVLEDQRKPLDRLLSSNREFRRKFTSRLEVPVFINDELVTFGQTYAQENGYRIDEMSILALYSRIDSLQREDHAVTIAEVKEIMDEAMAHSQKASAKKLMKRVFGKNTDDSDRIILTENDFNI